MTTEQSKPKKKRFVVLIAIAGVVLIGAFTSYLMNAGYETTDNAQIDADIIPIRSSVTGYVKHVYFKDNQFVHKGDLLIEIDDQEFQARVIQATAALENAKANLEAVKNNADAGVKNADAAFLSSESSGQNIEVTKARLTKIKEDQKRIKNMFATNASTKAELDAVNAEVEVAQAQYNASCNQFAAASKQSSGVKSQAEGQKSMISLAEALVKQRQAELTLALTQLEYTKILAPCDGLVSKRSVDDGQFITTGSPVCSEIDNQHLWITANFKETQVNRLRPGQAVEVHIDAYPTMHVTGKVESFIGATGAKFSLLPPDNSTGNFVKIVQRVPVRISLNKLTKNQTDLLLPGLSAFVSVKAN
ncbi:MAG: HlyD family secretion protein [Flavobacteriales bacterium]